MDGCQVSAGAVAWWSVKPGRLCRALVTLWFLGMIAAAWGQESTPPTASPAPSNTATPADVDRWIGELNDPRYRVREEAMRQLKTAGAVAIPAVVRATQSESAETARRAAELLAMFYRTVTFPEGVAVEETLAELRKTSGSIGDRAQDAWESESKARNLRTVPQLEALGAIIRYREKEDFPLAGEASQINYVVISEKWVGSDDQLQKLLQRLSPIAGIQVYHVNGSKVTEEAMLKIADLGYKVERRGAFLGIRNGRELLGAMGGCLVGGVTKDSPAEVAGLMAEDLITAYGDQEVLDFFSMIDLLQKGKPGERVVLTVKRLGETLMVPVELGNW